MNELALPKVGLRTMHLFAGSGGGVLADLLLGHTPVCAVEINEHRRNTLLARQRDGILPRFGIWDDVQTFDGKPWSKRVDLIAAGFPCDDISQAGKKAGIDGPESSLFGEVCRIASEVRPGFLFLENSGQLVGRGLARVIGRLAGLGYDSRWCRLGSGHIGADHERVRTWIVSNADGWKRKMEWDISGGRRIIQHLEGNLAGRAVDQPWIVGRDNVVASRMDRLSAIGSGQDPAVAALAWRILSQ